MVSANAGWYLNLCRTWSNLVAWSIVNLGRTLLFPNLRLSLLDFIQSYPLSKLIIITKRISTVLLNERVVLVVNLTIEIRLIVVLVSRDITNSSFVRWWSDTAASTWSLIASSLSLLGRWPDINRTNIGRCIRSKNHASQVHLRRLVMIYQKRTLHHQLLHVNLIIIFQLLYILPQQITYFQDALRFRIVTHRDILLILLIIILFNFTLIEFEYAFITSFIFFFILLIGSILTRCHIVVCSCSEGHIIWVHVELLCVSKQIVKARDVWQIVFGELVRQLRLSILVDELAEEATMRRDDILLLTLENRNIPHHRKIVGIFRKWHVLARPRIIDSLHQSVLVVDLRDVVVRWDVVLVAGQGHDIWQVKVGWSFLIYHSCSDLIFQYLDLSR